MDDLDVTVLTPSIPSRAMWLREAMESVQAQTVKPRAHLIAVGTPGQTPPMAHLVEQRNALALDADTAWISTLDDDDYFEPWHFETIAGFLDNPDLDVVFTYDEEFPGSRVDITGWTQEQLVAQLEVQNVIFSNAAIRLEALWAAGGWSIEGWDPVSHLYHGGPVCMEDWDLWLRMARNGCRFLCIPVATWHYRRGAPESLMDHASRLMSRPTPGVLHGA